MFPFHFTWSLSCFAFVHWNRLMSRCFMVWIILAPPSSRLEPCFLPSTTLPPATDASVCFRFHSSLSLSNLPDSTRTFSLSLGHVLGTSPRFRPPPSTTNKNQFAPPTRTTCETVRIDACLRSMCGAMEGKDDVRRREADRMTWTQPKRPRGPKTNTRGSGNSLLRTVRHV